MKALIWIVNVILLFGLLAYIMTGYNESAASKAYAQGQARAMIIEAQGQARLDSAQANAVNLASTLPYVILGIVVVFGAVILVSAVAMFRQVASPKIERIETRYVLMLPSGSKRQMYQRLGDGIKLIEGK